MFVSEISSQCVGNRDLFSDHDFFDKHSPRDTDFLAGYSNMFFEDDNGSEFANSIGDTISIASLDALNKSQFNQPEYVSCDTDDRSTVSSQTLCDDEDVVDMLRIADRGKEWDLNEQGEVIWLLKVESNHVRSSACVQTFPFRSKAGFGLRNPSEEQLSRIFQNNNDHDEHDEHDFFDLEIHLDVQDSTLSDPRPLDYVPASASVPPPRFKLRKTRTQIERHRRMRTWMLQRLSTAVENVAHARNQSGNNGPASAITGSDSARIPRFKLQHGWWYSTV